MNHFVKLLLFGLLTYDRTLCSALCHHGNEIQHTGIEKPEHSEQPDVASRNINPVEQNNASEQNYPVDEVNGNNTENATHIECACALFTTRFPAEDDLPLMSQSFHNVSRHDHESGEDVCIKFCIAFALSHHDEKDDIICSQAYNASDITIYLQSKMLGENYTWNFSGLSTTKPICCEEGKTVSCRDENVEGSNK